MRFEYELYSSPETEIPEVQSFEATCVTEAGNIAYGVLGKVRQEIIRGWMPMTRQEWKDLQAYLSFLHISFGPVVDREDSGEIRFKRR